MAMVPKSPSQPASILRRRFSIGTRPNATQSHVAPVIDVAPGTSMSSVNVLSGELVQATDAKVIPQQTTFVSGLAIVYPMVTRSKDGIRKPKIWLSTRHPLPTAVHAIASQIEPTCYSIVAKCPK